jgi:hypothetical protein
MIQKAIAAYQRLVRFSARSRPVVSLEVTPLEERATPTATPTFAPLVAVPQTVLVAPNVVVAPATASLVRLDLLGAGQSPAHNPDDSDDLRVQHRQEADAPPAALANVENLAARQEELELEEFLAAQQAA